MSKKLLSLVLALTLVLTFTLSVAAAGPGGSPPSGGGGTPPGGGGSSSSVSYSGATTVTSASTLSNGTYTSTTADENALLINTSGAVTVNNATVTKSGDSDGGDSCNFYGINSAIMCMGGGTTTINGGTVTATAKGANGIFSYGGNGGSNGAAGDGTTVIINNVTVNTTGSNGGGIMTTGGGITYANDCTVTTSGQSSAPLRTDRGGGTVYVDGGTYTSSGLGSPAIYCTADITAEDATFISKLSEGVCIEGKNSVILTNCDLTATNTKMNGNATFLDTIMIYQSMSGDADSGTSSYTMTGGTLTSNSGHVFHVTNTNAVITLSDVTIINNDSDNVLLSVCDDGWSGASNIATLNADGQTLEGTILVGSDSTLTLNLSDGSVYTGTISGNITNAKGSNVSTSVGTVNVTLDSTSKWYLTGDTYITSFSGDAANVINNGYTLYVNGTALAGTSDSDSGSTETPTEASTTAPTEAPTEAPTTAPTEAPTETPTEADDDIDLTDAFAAWVFDSTDKTSGDKLKEYGSADDGYAATTGSGTLTLSVDGESGRALEWSDAEYGTSGTDIVPIMSAGKKNLWGTPYIQVQLNASDYEDLTFTAYIAGSNKAPATWQLSYSIDGETFTDIDDALFTITTANRKLLTAYLDGTALPEAAEDAQTLYLRLTPTSTTTVSGGSTADDPTGGEIALNYIIVTGTEKSEEESYLLGDADGDGEVTILDATRIQRYLASLTDEIDEKAADINGDGIDIIDATYIQRYLASLEVPYPVNEWVTG